MSDSFQVNPKERESKQSFQEFLQLHINENQERTLTSPTQEINYSSIKNLGIKKTTKREDSEPSFRIMEAPGENNDKNLQSMQSKIQLLITENSKLIEINSGLMREIEIMKQNNQSNRSIIAQESQQKLMNYQNKVVQLTQANEQLSSRLIDEQTKNKKENEIKIHQILEENNNLNEIIQTRLNDIEILNNQVVERNNQIHLLHEEIKVLNEKCMILEQQKQVLIAQQTHYSESFKDLQIKEQQLIKQIMDDQVQYQSCVANLESNYNIQITELRNSFLKEIEQQQNALAQQYQVYFNQQILTYQQQLKTIQQENISIKDELNERSKIWSCEKDRLEGIIKSHQQLMQIQKQSIVEATPIQQPSPPQSQLPQQFCSQQQQISNNQSFQNQSQSAEEQAQQLQEQQKLYYQEIQQIQQQHYQQKINHQSSNYTFRQNTQEDSKEVSPDRDDSFQYTEKYPRLRTENYCGNYEKYQYTRPPLVAKNYKVPQLNTLTRYDQKSHLQSQNQLQYYQQCQRPKFMVNREPVNQRSISQYQEREDSQKQPSYTHQYAYG